MKRIVAMCFAVGFMVAVAFSVSAADAKGKTYQKTGPVVEVTDTKIVIETKDDGNWEIARDAATKVTGELKVGAKVTVEYRMIAVSAEVKTDKAEAKADKAEKKAAGK